MPSMTPTTADKARFRSMRGLAGLSGTTAGLSTVTLV